MREHTNVRVMDGVDLSLRQMTAAWQLLCAGSPARATASGEGFEYIFAGVPVPFFNVALITAREVTAAALVSHAHAACTWASRTDVPWLFVITHERLEPGLDAAAVLDGCGLAPAMPLTGMFAQRVAPGVAPPGLELVIPAEDAGCGAALDVNGAAYGMDVEAAKPLIGRRAFWEDHALVLGLTDGAPACSAAVMLVDGYRYVALVATIPGQQRRGFGDAAMRRALEVSAGIHGELPTVLHATEAGRPVYERMGYETISMHTTFMEKRFLAAH